MHKFKFAALAALSSFALSGCATVINGNNQDYKIKTDPAGAKISFNNGLSCESPCKLELKRRKDFRADVAKEGYKPAYVLIQSQFGGAVVGNIILGGIVGGVVDSANGSTNHLAPAPLSLRLAPLGSDQEAMLLDKKGKVVSTLQAHNDKVRNDLLKTLGADLVSDSGKAPAGAEAAVPAATATEAAPAPQPSPTPQ